MPNLLDDLRQRGEDAVKELLGRSEGSNLEFKVKEDDRTPFLSKGDKKNLGAALSGFSNSDGGLVIFGVKTKKKDRVDVAEELKPIADIDRFKNEVEGRIDELIRPANPEIDVYAIKCLDNPDYGYLLIKIGKSENRPHMSIAPDHAKYFRRSFDRTLVMDHALIRDQIMAPKEAVLVPSIGLLHRGTNHHENKATLAVDLEIYLQNVGRSMASMPYARVWTTPSLSPRNVNDLAPLSPRPDGSFAFYGSRDAVIHPSDKILFGAFGLAFVVDRDALNHALEEELDLREQPGLWRFGRTVGQGPAIAGNFDELDMRIDVGAENATVDEEHKFFPKADLITLVLPVALKAIHNIQHREQALAKALADMELAFGPNAVARLKV